MLLVGNFAIMGKWDKTACPHGCLPVYLHPGLCQGYGWEQSTKDMLAKMQGVRFSGRTVLDIGTGSGILAIAAYRLGAKRVHATDKHPSILAQTKANLRANNMSAKLMLTTDVPSGSWDIILCNLGDEFWVSTNVYGLADTIIYSTREGEVLLWQKDQK